MNILDAATSVDVDLDLAPPPCALIVGCPTPAAWIVTLACRCTTRLCDRHWQRCLSQHLSAARRGVIVLHASCGTRLPAADAMPTARPI